MYALTLKVRLLFNVITNKMNLKKVPSSVETKTRQNHYQNRDKKTNTYLFIVLLKCLV